jgi:hypothetical protein
VLDSDRDLPSRIATAFLDWIATMTKPKYLTGDSAAINEFIDRFDVRC